ncbi:hypothetical protein BMG03_19175 (plasmid) [Thioclava nitratireducens]|uniref:DUF1403 family protein n=1 Tax=Thioclava nitratireducens TaxID=1915078 RepID=A0ABN4XL83_9RHOB|nr:DUF1403 family protein [Thioclava nitratireducens]AQS50048.1 hypothetical protein BMG03_19175 [Thioclava nitratireducens]
MTSQKPDISDARVTLPQLPAWVTQGHRETPEDVAFLSGATLIHLRLVLTRDDPHQALLRERLALRAAEVCATHSGRPERAAELRDAVHLLREGDLPGPAGENYLAWRRAVERPVSGAALQRALPGHPPEALNGWFAAGQGAPVAQAAGVLEAVLADAPRALLAALILADAALAQALGWSHVTPLLANGLKRADLRLKEANLRLACHRAVHSAGIEAARLSTNLTRRTARLRAVAPKLRAKGAAEAVTLFLTRDAIAPAALPLPDRAARRLCDRLVQLGAIRELTGRDTFRLYGV